MVVRPATSADSEELVRLAGLMYETLGAQPTAEWRARAETEFSKRIGDGVVGFVADRPDGRAGLAAGGVGVISTRLPSPRSLDGRVGYIMWVSTEVEFRRRGLAREVMDSLLAWFEDNSVLTVELHATPDGEPLYRSLGFDQGGGLPLRKRSGPGPC